MTSPTETGAELVLVGKLGFGSPLAHASGITRTARYTSEKGHQFELKLTAPDEPTAEAYLLGETALALEAHRATTPPAAAPVSELETEEELPGGDVELLIGYVGDEDIGGIELTLTDSCTLQPGAALCWGARYKAQYAKQASYTLEVYRGRVQSWMKVGTTSYGLSAKGPGTYPSVSTPQFSTAQWIYMYAVGYDPTNSWKIYGVWVLA